MRLVIMSGQPNANIKRKFSDLILNEHVNFEDILEFPERNTPQPKQLYDAIKTIVEERIYKNRDLYVLTYSEYVFNALRVEVKKHKFTGAKVHQIGADGSDTVAEIDVHGKLDVWVKDIFDVSDFALMELL